MNWQEYYKIVSNKPEKCIKIGIRDWEQRSSIILKWIKNSFDKKSRILDCGCGIGIFGQIMKENGYRNIIGIDFNEKSLRCAKNFYSVNKMDCQNLALVDNFYDVIVALNVIEHLEDPKQFLTEIKRITKPNSLYVFSTPNVNFIRKLIRPIKCKDHKHFWNIKQFIGMLDKNKFKVLNVKGVGRFKNLLLCQTFMVLCSYE